MLLVVAGGIPAMIPGVLVFNFRDEDDVKNEHRQTDSLTSTLQMTSKFSYW